MMDSEERDVFFYLNGQADLFVSAIAIRRHAGGEHKSRAQLDWARPVLLRMIERGILETDESNMYRLKPIPERPATKRWISPQIASILQRSGRNFKGLVENTGDAETYYDQL